MLDAGARIVALGGDHSVSLPLLRAAAAKHGRLSLLQIDAHTDTWDSYFGAKVTHGTIFRRAAEEEIIDARTSVQIGLRGSVYASTDYAENAELGFTTLMARDLDRVGIDGAVALALENLRSPVYITVDIDCLDPAFAPGTGTPEAGGLTSRELLGILRGLAREIDVGCADVVEVSPPYDPSGVTAVAGANAAYELIGLVVLSLVADARPSTAAQPSRNDFATLARARYSRLVIVPSLTPASSAASRYERPAMSIAASASRNSAGSSATAARTSLAWIAASGALAPLRGSAIDSVSSSTRAAIGRREASRRWPMNVLRSAPSR